MITSPPATPPATPLPPRLTAEDLTDIPEDDGEGCGCDFGEDTRRALLVTIGGIWRPQGARPLGAEEELELV